MTSKNKQSIEMTIPRCVLCDNPHFMESEDNSVEKYCLPCIMKNWDKFSKKKLKMASWLTKTMAAGEPR